MKQLYVYNLRAKERDDYYKYLRIKEGEKYIKEKITETCFVYWHANDFYNTLDARVKSVIDWAQERAWRRRHRHMPFAGNSETIMRNRNLRHYNLTGVPDYDNKFQYGGNR
jgi:hypothetical protein